MNALPDVLPAVPGGAKVKVPMILVALGVAILCVFLPRMAMSAMLAAFTAAATISDPAVMPGLMWGGTATPSDGKSDGPSRYSFAIGDISVVDITLARGSVRVLHDASSGSEMVTVSVVSITAARSDSAADMLLTTVELDSSRALTVDSHWSAELARADRWVLPGGKGSTRACRNSDAFRWQPAQAALQLLFCLYFAPFLEFFCRRLRSRSAG
eukprot:SAG31_NODE_159_length_21911_cov_12.220750_4_plen_213_part_00